jgi:hypothetical protein
MINDANPVAAGAPPLPAAARLGLRVAAPVWLAGWVVMRLGGHRGPSAGWDLAHSLWIVAFVLFGLAFVGLHRLAVRAGVGRAAAAAVLGVTLTGTVALLAQMGCDLAVGMLSADHAEMSDRYDDLFAVPGVELALFQVGPALLFAGLLGTAWLAFRRGAVPGSSLALMALGVVAMGAGRSLPGALRLVEGLGAVCLALALLPLAGNRPRADAADPSPA